MTSRSTQLRGLLSELEFELRALHFWSIEPPAASALQSQTPFCCDTLLLQEWLQWVFIPRLAKLLDEGRSLPRNCNVHAYATEALKGVELDIGNLLRIIETIDRLLSEQRRLH
ncbi:MAG: YqcC family protein [Pseudomonadota bacterium]